MQVSSIKPSSSAGSIDGELSTGAAAAAWSAANEYRQRLAQAQSAANPDSQDRISRLETAAQGMQTTSDPRVSSALQVSPEAIDRLRPGTVIPSQPLL